MRVTIGASLYSAACLGRCDVSVRRNTSLLCAAAVLTLSLLWGTHSGTETAFAGRDASTTGVAQEALPPGFTSLFNGKDLSGWKVPQGDGGHWKVLDGVIENAQMPGVPANGPIGLQHHGAMRDGQWTGPPSLLQFRNISIKPL